jgi:uncharacterized protein (DUF934 family)
MTNQRDAVEVTEEDLDLEAWFLRRMEGACWEGRVARLLARHRLAAEAAMQARVAELEAEIARLRGLLIDPGEPAWEDARAVLAAELVRARHPLAADAVAAGDAVMVPSWIALNLIGHASRTTLRNT